MDSHCENSDTQTETSKVDLATGGDQAEEDAESASIKQTCSDEGDGESDAMDDCVDVMVLLNQFKDLAAHPRSRTQLIQDATSLGGLVLLLNDQDPKIVEHTLEIFLLLTKSKESCQALFHQLGFIESLDNVVIEYGDRREDGGNVARMAVQILNKLTARPPRPHSPASSNSSRKSEDFSRKRDHRSKQRSFEPSNAPGVSLKPAKVPKQKSSSKTITLQIKGLLDMHDRDKCRDKLLEVKGVISLTFDMKKKRAVLRVKSDMKAEELVQAILRTETMSANQVVLDEDGNETLISFHNLTLNGDEDDAREDDYPDYLSDADDFPTPEQGDKAMSRLKGEGVEEGSSWFSSVSSFVKDAFYW